MRKSFQVCSHSDKPRKKGQRQNNNTNVCEICNITTSETNSARQKNAQNAAECRIAEERASQTPAKIYRGCYLECSIFRQQATTNMARHKERGQGKSIYHQLYGKHMNKTSNNENRKATTKYRNFMQVQIARLTTKETTNQNGWVLVEDSCKPVNKTKQTKALQDTVSPI